MFGNVGNNNSNERNVNTKIKTFFGDLSCLQLTYWNENISIKINPLTGVNSDGIRQYDYNRRASTALTQEKCIAIADGIKKKILPLIENKTEPEKPVSVGVSVGTKGSAICVEYKKDDKGDPSAYLTIYTNIGADGKAPKDGIFTYKFAKTVVSENYDPETGESEDITVEAEFMFFYEKVKNVSDVIATAAHSVNNDAAYKRSNSGNYNSSANGSGGNGNYSAPVTNYSENDFPF